MKGWSPAAPHVLYRPPFKANHSVCCWLTTTLTFFLPHPPSGLPQHFSTGTWLDLIHVRALLLSKCRIAVFSAAATPPQLHPCINLIWGPPCRSILPIAHKDAGKISVLPSLPYYFLCLSCEQKSRSPHVLHNHDQILLPLCLLALMWKRNKCPSSQGVILLPVSVMHIPIRRPLLYRVERASIYNPSRTEP